MTEPEMKREDDVKNRLDKLMADIALLKENVMRSEEKIMENVEYIKATALRANIRETSLVPLFNEQGEKEKGKGDEREFSWCCSFSWGVG